MKCGWRILDSFYGIFVVKCLVLRLAKCLEISLYFVGFGFQTGSMVEEQGLICLKVEDFALIAYGMKVC